MRELRRAALSERAERMLTLGRFDQLVSDLEPLVRSDPLHERYAAQLMTALFNAGRQANALAVFDRTRTALVEELGADPSRELRATMAQILRHDEAVVRGTGSTINDPPVGGATSTNLPIRGTSFVGRQRCRPGSLTASRSPGWSRWLAGVAPGRPPPAPASPPSPLGA
jgi:Bacterial transcriptional activator domain